MKLILVMDGIQNQSFGLDVLALPIAWNKAAREH